MHRQQAENAENRANKAQDEASDAQDSANEAMTKGYRLTEAVKARAAAQSGLELKAKSIGGPSGESQSTQGDLDYLASMADELFPLYKSQITRPENASEKLQKASKMRLAPTGSF